MAMKGWINVANGFVSAVLLACGIVLSVLIASLYGKLHDAASQSRVTVSNSTVQLETDYARAITYWVVGFTFIIPGVFGIIASIIRMKHGYILQIVLFIVALCIALAVHAGTIRDVSVDRLFSLEVSCPIFTSCEEADLIVNMGIGAGVMVLLGWICALIGIILAGFLISQQKMQEKMVYRNAPMPVAAPWVQYPQPRYEYTPQPVPVTGFAPYAPKPVVPYQEKSRGYKLRIIGSYPASSVHAAQEQPEIHTRQPHPIPVVQPATNLVYADHYDEIPLDREQPVPTKLAHLKDEPTFFFNPVIY